MLGLKRSLIFVLVCVVFYASHANAMSIPKDEGAFFLATDELVRKYDGIVRFHSERSVRRPNLLVNNLSELWGEPKQVKQNRGNLYGSVFLGAASMLLTLPNPILAISAATGLGTLNYWRTQEVMVWDKGDYLIEVNTRTANHRRLVSSWIWKYKSLDRAVPIIGGAREPKNYFMVGYGRGLSGLLNGQSNYGNGQYFLLAHRIASLSQYRVFVELGAHWGLPGKSTPDNAQWVRIPVNLALKTASNALGFSYGIGAGYQFAKEFSSTSESIATLKGARSIYAYTEYRFSSQLSFGIRDTLQAISQGGTNLPLMSNQLSTYASIRF